MKVSIFVIICLLISSLNLITQGPVIFIDYPNNPNETMSALMFLLLLTGGCVSGLFAGLLGLGGGMIFMLIFANYLAYVKAPVQLIPQMILANSMFAMFIGGFAGSVKHYLNRNLPLKLVLTVGVSAAVSALVVTHFFIHSKFYNKDVFTFIFILVISYVACSVFLVKPKTSPRNNAVKYSTGGLSLIGIAGGSLSAMAGVGGGIVVIPMLTGLLNIGIKKATAISLGVITVVSFCTTFYALLASPTIPLPLPYAYGLILFPMALPVTLGCVLFAPIGVALSHKISSTQVKLLFLLFLIAATFNLLRSL